MSMRHVVWVFDNADDLNPSQKLMLLAIADGANEKTSLSFPGLNKLMKRTGTKKRNALRLISQLEEKGYLRQVEAAKPGRRAAWIVVLNRTEWVTSAAPERVPSTAEWVPSTAQMGDVQSTPFRIPFLNDLSSNDEEETHPLNIGVTRKIRVKGPLPTDWSPNETHRAFARSWGFDIDFHEANFRLHAKTNGRTAVDWDAAFEGWLLKATEGREKPRQVMVSELTNEELIAALGDDDPRLRYPERADYYETAAGRHSLAMLAGNRTTTKEDR